MPQCEICGTTFVSYSDRKLCTDCTSARLMLEQESEQNYFDEVESLIYDHLDPSVCSDPRDVLEIRSGGREPKELFTLPKVMIETENGQFLWLADILFTDLGLLIVGYHFFPRPAGSGERTLRLLLTGLAGDALMRFFESRDVKAAMKAYDRNKARFTYFQGSPQPENSFYRFATRGIFLPADEMKPIEAVGENTITVSFRRITYAVTSFDFSDTALLKTRVKQFNQWRVGAAESRSQLSGGPTTCSFNLLLEWARRPLSDETPDWVSDCIVSLVNTKSDETQRSNKRSLPEIGIPSPDARLDWSKLRSRLSRMSNPRAQKLSSEVRQAMAEADDKLKARAKTSVWAGSILFVSAVGCGLGSQFVNPVSGWDAICIFMAVLLGVVGFIVLLWPSDV